MILTIIIFLLAIALLVLVHELGHFILAKRAGILVEEFGFGFPPRLFSFKKGETLYSFNLVPLGGFVKIKGENGDDRDDQRSFTAKPIWVRALIIVAGVAMNFALAVILFIGVFKIGAPMAVDDNYQATDSRIVVNDVEIDSPASMIGLEIGDVIVSVAKEGENFGDQITKVNDLTSVLSGLRGQKIVVKYQRVNTTFEKDVVLRSDVIENQGLLGIGISRVTNISYSWWESFKNALLFSIDIAITIVSLIGKIIYDLFVGVKPAVDFGGPVRIYGVTEQATERGLVYIMQLVALLSINLSVINILPFPALDGGRLLFLLIEKIKGSPINQKIEAMANNIGFGLLILLMILITFKDISRIF